MPSGMSTLAGRFLPHGLLLRLLYSHHYRRAERAEAPIREELGLPFLTKDAAARVKRSDTVFILGSGPSINDIPDARWSAIRAANSMGLNFWPFHRFVPDIYFFENRPCRPGSEAAEDRGGGTFAELFARRAGDYAPVLKVVMGLHHPEPHLLQRLPDAMRSSLFTARTVTPVARSYAELVAALHYLAGKGMFVPDAGYDSLLKYNGTITTLITLAVKMDYRHIVLCGVDLGKQQYFWQDPGRYPESSGLEFAPRNAPHHTATSNPWMVPMHEVIRAVRGEVLEPAGIHLYVESRSSALYPTVEEAPEGLYEALRTKSEGMAR